MNRIQIVAISSFVTSYLILCGILIFEFNDSDLPLPVIITWFFGIISVVSNSLLSEKISQNKWTTPICIISGIVWLFPPLIFTYFGIPFLIIHLGVVIFIHVKSRKVDN